MLFIIDLNSGKQQGGVKIAGAAQPPDLTLYQPPVCDDLLP